MKTENTEEPNAQQDNKIKLPFAAVKILSESDAINLINNEPKKWHVVSLWSGGGGKHGNARPEHLRAKSLCQKRFHDIEREEEGMILCNKWHIQTILDYVRTLYNTDETLAIHCYAGISRSSAIAFIIFLNYYKDKSLNPIEDALKIIDCNKKSRTDSSQQVYNEFGNSSDC